CIYLFILTPPPPHFSPIFFLCLCVFFFFFFFFFNNHKKVFIISHPPLLLSPPLSLLSLSISPVSPMRSGPSALCCLTSLALPGQWPLACQVAQPTLSNEQRSSASHTSPIAAGPP